MKKIKILILIFIIIVILLICFMFFLNNNKNSSLTPEEKEGYSIYKTNNPTPPSGGTAYKGDNILKESTIETQYFNIKDIIDKYFYECKNLNLKDSEIQIPRIKMSQEEQKKYIKEQKSSIQELSKEVLLSILGNEYIKEFGIDKNNLSNKFGIDYLYKYIIDNILVINNNDRISTFIVNGNLINIQKNSNTDFKLMICMDATNKTYYIYPQEYLIKHGINNLKSGNKLDIEISEIKENNHNKYEIQDVSDEIICKEYFNNFKTMFLYNSDKLYNILDKDYSKKRFGSVERFNEYINENKNTIQLSVLSKYVIINNMYVCTDNNNYDFIFKRNDGLFDYSVLLDNYTMKNNTEFAIYSKLGVYEKCKYNLETFEKMLNAKDYYAIYNILNKTFKEKNYKNVNDLKNYIKNNFYNINDIEIQSSTEKDNYYLFICKLKNKENSVESKSVNIIISKTNNMEFEMSFGF